MTETPKAILLDMDDTIICYDQGVDTDECWRRAIRGHARSEIADSTEHLLNCIKERARWHWSDPERHRVGRLDLNKARQGIVAAALMEATVDDFELAGRIAYTFGEERDKAFALFPDSIESMKQFRAKGIKLALLTNGNGEVQWKKIRRFDLQSYFDCILVEGEFGVGKPDDRIYLHALERLGVTAEEAWMVGDNFEWEVVAPQRLGIKGIWVDHAGKGCAVDAASRPFGIIKSLGELISLIPSGSAEV